ncbi:MAG: glycosyltransferase family 2 protein [Thermoanaerobaculia bacterium]
MSRVSIVVPVYHNAGSLPDLLARLGAVAARHPADVFEFVCVDDGSKDDSLAVLMRLQREETRLRVVKLSRNFGSNAALLAGLAHAEGDVVATISADLQDPPETLDAMLAHWREGRKVVLAVRESRDDPFASALLASVFYRLFRRYAIPTMPKRGFDFFAIDRRVKDLILGIQESNAYLMGLVLWLGFDPALVPFHRQRREERYGRSMWSFGRKVKYFIDSFVAFSYVPIRAASVLGLLVSAAGLLYATFIVFAHFVLDVKVQGWASLMIVLLVVSGAQLLVMGVIGEYLWRNLDETRRRPRFIVEAVLEPESRPRSS